MGKEKAEKAKAYAVKLECKTIERQEKKARRKAQAPEADVNNNYSKFILMRILSSFSFSFL
jgi:hypothetical protein